MKRAFGSSVLSLGLGLSLLCCNSTGVGNPGVSQLEQRLIDDGTIALQAGDTSSSVNSMATLSLRDPREFTDSVAVATLVEERTPLYFEPAGCLTTTRDAAAVTFTFDGCRTGAFGLLELNGSMDVTYTVDATTAIGFSLRTTPSLQMGGTVVSLESESLLTVEGVTSSLVGNGTYRADHPLRADVEHSFTFLATYELDSLCLSIDGTSTTLFGNESAEQREGVEATLSDYLRCGSREACPSAGQLSLTRLPDRELDLSVEYDGDRSAWVPELELEVEVSCRE